MFQRAKQEEDVKKTKMWKGEAGQLNWGCLTPWLCLFANIIR